MRVFFLIKNSAACVLSFFFCVLFYYTHYGVIIIIIIIMMVKFFILFFTNPNKTNKYFNQLRKIIHFLYPHWTHSSLRVNLYSRTVKNTYARTTLHGRQRNVFLVLVLGERCRHKRRWWQSMRKWLCKKSEKSGKWDVRSSTKPRAIDAQSLRNHFPAIGL